MIYSFSGTGLGGSLSFIKLIGSISSNTSEEEEEEEEEVELLLSYS